MGVAKNRVKPQYGLLFDGKPYLLMDHLGVPLFLETPKKRIHGTIKKIYRSMVWLCMVDVHGKLVGN